MAENSETRIPNGFDGLVAGMLDVMAALAMLHCQSAQIEPAALAQALVNATETTITPDTLSNYATGRRFAVAKIAETLRGLELPKKQTASSGKGFEVILGGLAARPGTAIPADQDGSA